MAYEASSVASALAPLSAVMLPSRLKALVARPSRAFAIFVSFQLALRRKAASRAAVVTVHQKRESVHGRLRGGHQDGQRSPGAVTAAALASELASQDASISELQALLVEAMEPFMAAVCCSPRRPGCSWWPPWRLPCSPPGPLLA